MARGMDPESRPISVAELLARAKEQGADDVASAVGSSPAATGRRRRGGKDSVSVAELTGEIPRVTSQPKAAEKPQPKADEVPQPKADEVSQPKADSPPTLPPTRDFSSAEVSKRAAAEKSGAAPTPGAPDRPAPLGARPATASGPGVTPKSDSADASADPTSASAAPEKDSADAGPDAAGADEETTGVIPSMQAYSQVDDSGDDDHRVLSAAEREREFERYRNFEDIETGEDAVPASSGGKKKKRGLFGFGRKADTEPKPDADGDVDGDVDDHADRTVTQFIPKVAGDSGETGPDPETSTPERESEPEPERVPMSRAQAAKSADDRYLRFDTDSDPTVATPALAGAAKDVDTAKSIAVTDESPTSEIGQLRDTGAFGASAAGSDEESATGEQAADTTVKHSLIKDVPEPSDSGRESAAGTSGGAEEQSPTVQWLVLIGQVLAGLAVGVALFWGFTELWRWNVLFALILSVAVIFGLVTFVHVVRRSNDLISTLLAMGVGLLVTIGPLVLLLIAGD